MIGVEDQLSGLVSEASQSLLGASVEFISQLQHERYSTFRREFHMISNCHPWTCMKQSTSQSSYSNCYDVPC